MEPLWQVGSRGPFISWARVFLIIGFCTGAFLARETPLGHVPDEIGHICRADSLLHGAFFGQGIFQTRPFASGVPCDVALSQVITLPAHPTDPTPEILTPSMRLVSSQVTWTANALFPSYGSISSYFPLFYVPGAIAIRLVQTFGGSPADAFLAVRYINLAFFLLFGWTALRLTRRGHAIIACTLLLPMTLALAGSSSQDGLLIASTCLACACLTRISPQPTTHSDRWLTCAAILLTAVSISKPPYAPLTGLLLLPKAIAWRRRLAACALACLPALAWIAVQAYSMSPSTAGAPVAAGPLWPGPHPVHFSGPNIPAQFKVLAASPRLIVTLPWSAFLGNANMLLHQAVGVLDYLCIFLPRPLYALWFAALAAALLWDATAPPGSHTSSVQESCKIAALVYMSASAVALALYLQWTPVGMPWIGGLQGRYFIPFLPIIAIALPCIAIPGARKILWPLPIAAFLADVVVIPMTIHGFYSTGS